MNSSNRVLIISLVIAAVFVLWGTLSPNHLTEITTNIQDFLQKKFGWFYLLSATAFLLFVVILIFSRFGNIKLGKDDEEPEHSYLSWFAMLFSAGMGIGLVFWGVAEPLSHYAAPPLMEEETPQAAQAALKYSLFHWGLHPWGIYTLIGLGLAYFKFRKKAPGLVSTIFTPILGDRVNGPIGRTIDILAVFATVFGVATSLGFGAVQIAGGLSFLFNGIENNFATQTIIIVLVTILFCISAVSGIDRGIKFLSNMNVLIAVLLMFFLLFVGPTNFMMNFFTSTLGAYLQELPQLSLRITPFPESELSQWTQDWTVFYWAWWIAWAPFVGTFIARISRGRTIREFIVGVLTVPTIFSALWFSVLGGSGIYSEMFHNAGIIDVMNKQGTEIALFKFLEQLPLSPILIGLAILLISTFFITSADSATFVLGMLTTGGRLNPTKTIKLTWGAIQSTAAVVLLASGGLAGLQTASIIAAFPFTFILIGISISLYKTLQTDVPKLRRR